jgi:Putative threonine/serine exporter
LPFESLAGENGRRGDQASPDLARLPGARLVRASEPERGANFKESLLKSLTGGLVPGFPLIAALFDLLHYQTLAAVSRFIYGAMILLAVAFGVSIVIAVAGIDISRQMLALSFSGFDPQGGYRTSLGGHHALALGGKGSHRSQRGPRLHQTDWLSSRTGGPPHLLLG